MNRLIKQIEINYLKHNIIKDKGTEIMFPVWSPDNNSIIYLSNKEYELMKECETQFSIYRNKYIHWFDYNYGRNKSLKIIPDEKYINGFWLCSKGSNGWEKIAYRYEGHFWLRNCSLKYLKMEC